MRVVTCSVEETIPENDNGAWYENAEYFEKEYEQK